MDTLLKTAQGNFRLNRQSIQRNDQLRAWDAADEYILNYLAEDLTSHQNPNILILNDSFGALAVALHGFYPQAISDSYLSQQATLANLSANNIACDQVILLDSLTAPTGVFAWVLIKTPKTLALLEDQLIRILPHIDTSTKIIIAGMSKYIPTTVWQMLERLMGPTNTLLTKKKAKLIICRPEPKRTILNNPYPSYYTLADNQEQICNHANVFAREKLDIGTRFLLDHLPTGSKAQNIIDLGCGNGVVGLMLAKLHSGAVLHFVDESYMAIASARETFKLAFNDLSHATFKVNDSLSGFAPASMDLVVCNPPFHQQNSIDSHTAKRMFKQARKVLREGGELRIIGNRHLGYHVTLKKLFGNANIIAANSKFVIISAIVETKKAAQSIA